MPKQKGLTNILLLSVMIVVLLLSSYIFLNRSKYIYKDEVGTSLWNEYDSKKLGLKLKYPDNLKLAEINDRSFTIFNETNPSQGMRINLYVFDDEYNNIDGFITKNLCKTYDIDQAKSNACVEEFINSRQDVLISDQEAYKGNFILENMSLPVVIIPYYGLTYEFYAYYTANDDRYADIFDEVINSMVFYAEPQVQNKSDSSEMWSPVCKKFETESFDIEVESGFGITNIAREAISDYFTYMSIYGMEETFDEKYTLSAEEKIYAEDYIRKQLEPSELKVGEIITVSCGLVEEATLKSRLLTISQTKNLEKYSETVTDYQIEQMIQDVVESVTRDSKLRPNIIQF
jgi:hypothetical protein